MNVREFRDDVGGRVDRAYYRGEVTVIARNGGEPRAVLVSPEMYRRLLASEPSVDECA